MCLTYFVPSFLGVACFGVDVDDTLTDAIVWSNPEPVGSGPLRVRDRVVEEALVLERFEDHFVHRSTDAEQPLPGLDYRELHLRVAPASEAAVELAESGDVDGTMFLSDPAVVPRIGRATSLTLDVKRAPVLYHVGYNTRRDPLGDTAVRRTLARLIDKGYVAETVFDGYATPVAAPYAGTTWAPPSLDWSGSDPEVPFVGTGGELDVERARERIKDIGYDVEGGTVIRR